ncbi:MAG: hypothetical protein RL748_3094, partial [Pseudomonadota bacterium]
MQIRQLFITALTFASAAVPGLSYGHEPIWDGNKVQMVSEKLAPQVYAFYASDARELNAKG